MREHSYTHATLREVLSIISAEGMSGELLDVRELDLPVFLPDTQVDEYPAHRQAGILQLIHAFRRADAMIWASPTYHGTVSGAFKNALDFFELTIADIPPYLQGRPVGIISIADSAALAAMRNCAHELRSWLAPTQITVRQDDFDADLRLHNERLRGRLTRLVRELSEFIKRMN